VLVLVLALVPPAELVVGPIVDEAPVEPPAPEEPCWNVSSGKLHEATSAAATTTSAAALDAGWSR